MAVSKTKKPVVAVEEEVNTLGVSQDEVIETTQVLEEVVEVKELKAVSSSVAVQKNWSDFFSQNFEGINAFLNDIHYMNTLNNERHRIIHHLSQSPESLISNHYNPDAAKRLVEDIKNKFNY